MTAMKNYFRTKKLNLLATLLSITYAFLVANTFINNWDDFKRGFVDGWKNAERVNSRNKVSSSRNYHLSLSPKEGTFSYPDSLVNLRNHTTVKSINEQVIAVSSTDTGMKYSLWYDVFLFLIGWPIVITYFVIPYHFNKLLVRIKKNFLFEQDNIRLIRCLGIELLIVYFGNVLFNFIGYKIYTTLFLFSDYEIHMHSMDAVWLLFGIVVLLAAEILSKALEMKEEQELTI